MGNDEALFRLLRAIHEGDREAADDAVCHLRIGIVTMKDSPKISMTGSCSETLSGKTWTEYEFKFWYGEET